MTAFTDFIFNYPSVPAEATALAESFASLNDIPALLPFPPYQGSAETLAAAAGWLKLPAGVYPEVADIVLCTSGNQALSSILHVLQSQHPTIITEPFTYTAFLAIARQKGFHLEPGEFDEHGLTVAGLEKAMHHTQSKVVYLQPTIHNPTCVVMPPERRQDIAQFAKEKGLLLIEDDAYRFLCADAPPSFLNLLPEQTMHVASLSKPFNPSLKTTYLVAPVAWIQPLVDAVRLTSSGNSSLLSRLATSILTSGVLGQIVAQKQWVARDLQERAKTLLGELPYQTHPASYHLWLQLPETLKSTELVALAAQQQISISSGVNFSVSNPKEGERFVRLALAAEKDTRKIEAGIATIAELCRKGRQ
jgi:DNA-binding transcriptional MocR family regulator